MKKTYVLDTNVLIQSPHAFLNFEDNDIIIPFVVLEELDGLKKSDGEKGSNAREAVRKLEEFRICGNILDGITIEDGGTLRVEKNYKDIPLPEDLSEDKSDNRILQVCKGLKDNNTNGQEVILVTKDIVLRLKAQVIGIQAEDFTTEQITEDAAL